MVVDPNVIRHSRRIDSVVVVTRSGVGILVEVHQDVLNLGLLGRIHDHDYRLA